MTYRIRLATQAEISRQRDIEADAGQRFHEVGMPEIANNPGDDRLFTASFQRLGGMHVAEVAETGELAGFSLAGLLDGGGHLYELSVRESHGRQGLGRRLVEAAETYAYARGARFLTLATFRDVPWNAPYYKKLGFRILDREEWTPGLVILYRREQDVGLPIERRCFMRKELT